MGDPTMTTPANDPAGTSGGDFVGEVSAKITIAVIAEMLGVPREDWRLLFRWTNEIIAPQDPEFQHDASAEKTMDEARAELFSYFLELAERRRGAGRARGRRDLPVDHAGHPVHPHRDRGHGGPRSAGPQRRVAVSVLRVGQPRRGSLR